MLANNNRLQFAQWLLERNIAWIAAAEGKVGFVMAIVTAMLAALATAYGNAKAVDWFGASSALIAVLFCLLSVVSAACSVRARTDGPSQSLIFFGRIIEMNSAEYVSALSVATEEDLLSDLTRQIHRNAQIADAKHKWASASMNMAFWAAPFWAMTIAALIQG